MLHIVRVIHDVNLFEEHPFSVTISDPL